MNSLSDLKILIVDDEVLIAEYVKGILADEGAQKVHTVYDYQNALLTFDVFRPDIVLMDINLNGSATGIDLCKSINHNAKIIFLTAQTEMETMQKALQYDPVAYLTKPLKKVDLLASVYLALQKMYAKTIKVKNGTSEFVINQEDILYVKSDNVYLDIFTVNKNYTIRTTLESFYHHLDKARFKRPHRSYIVNKSAVTKITAKTVYINNTAIPVSRHTEIDW